MGRPLTRSDYYTTGQVAKHCGVAPRTAAGWVDRGLLRGFRVPPSQDRRVPHDALLEFCRRHGMPAPGVPASPALLVWAGVPLAASLALALPAWRVLHAADAFELGTLAQADPPAAAALDLALGTSEGLTLCRRLRERWPDCRVVALVGEDGAGMAEALGLGAGVADGWAAAALLVAGGQNGRAP